MGRFSQLAAETTRIYAEVEAIYLNLFDPLRKCPGCGLVFGTEDAFAEHNQYTNHRPSND